MSTFKVGDSVTVPTVCAGKHAGEPARVVDIERFAGCENSILVSFGSYQETFKPSELRHRQEAGGISKLPCYHVQTAQGQTYGVAATTARDALAMTQDRLSGESAGDRPVSAKRVDTWQADYGTVLHY